MCRPGWEHLFVQILRALFFLTYETFLEIRLYQMLLQCPLRGHHCRLDPVSDQAVLNYLVYSQQLQNASLRIELQQWGSGFTSTIGSFKYKASTFVRDHMRDGLVLSLDQSVAPVVHQYDRILRFPCLNRNESCNEYFRQHFRGFAAVPTPINFTALKDSRQEAV